MTNELTIANARHRLDALDLTAENARIAEIDVHLDQIAVARRVADVRLQEVLVLLRPFSGSREHASQPVFDERDGRNVAEALLAGRTAEDAATTKANRDQLEHERDALRDGLADLARRERALTEERGRIGPAVGRRILGELTPLCDELEEEAREAAKVVERCFASMSTIGRITRTSPAALQRLGEAVAGMRGAAGLLRAGNTVDVPSEITDLLAILSDKGPAYRGGKPASIQVHDRYDAGTTAIAMRGDRLPPRPGPQ